jgi:hypothetical protein
MNLWAIQRDVAMDGGDVSHLVATAFFEYANPYLGIADYHHFVAYFDIAIKQSYYTKFSHQRNIRALFSHGCTTLCQLFE